MTFLRTAWLGRFWSTCWIFLTFVLIQFTCPYPPLQSSLPFFPVCLCSSMNHPESCSCLVAFACLCTFFSPSLLHLSNSVFHSARISALLTTGVPPPLASLSLARQCVHWLSVVCECICESERTREQQSKHLNATFSPEAQCYVWIAVQWIHIEKIQ